MSKTPTAPSGAHERTCASSASAHSVFAELIKQRPRWLAVGQLPRVSSRAMSASSSSYVTDRKGGDDYVHAK